MLLCAHLLLGVSAYPSRNSEAKSFPTQMAPLQLRTHGKIHTVQNDSFAEGNHQVGTFYFEAGHSPKPQLSFGRRSARVYPTAVVIRRDRNYFHHAVTVDGCR